MNKKGFTLVEILVAVLIMIVLVTMAVPMYDKAVEKSRVAEARSVLKQVMESKMRLLELLEQDTYANTMFGFENLDYALACKSYNKENGHQTVCQAKDFQIHLLPSGESNQNAVCAVRSSGDNKGVNFLYLGELAENTDDKFLCHNGSEGGSCDVFGMIASSGRAWCSVK